MSLDKDPVDDPYSQNYNNHEAAWRPKANYDVMHQVHHSGVSHFFSLIKQKKFQLYLATGQQIASRLTICFLRYAPVSKLACSGENTS